MIRQAQAWGRKTEPRLVGVGSDRSHASLSQRARSRRDRARADQFGHAGPRQRLERECNVSGDRNVSQPHVAVLWMLEELEVPEHIQAGPHSDASRM